MEDFTNYLKLINNCDPDDPLISSTKLGERLSRIPLDCVNLSDLREPSQALNLEQLIHTEDGIARDYRGLGELLGFSKIEVDTRFKNSSNPTRSMIDAIISKNINNDRRFSLNDLLKLIEKIERFDVIDDLLPKLINLASFMPENQAQSNVGRSLSSTRSVSTQNVVKDKDRLTINDTHLATMQYDAFICYAHEDYQYAKELIDSLEDNGKSFATADHLLPGHFEHDALIRLINSRCKKMIVILTPNFLRSKECEFQTKFAGEIGYRSEYPKIIPLMYEVCDDSALPLMIQSMTKIDMTSRNGNNRSWQLRRLVRALDQGNQSYSQESSIAVNNSSNNIIEICTSSPAITYSNQSQMSETNIYEPKVDLMHSETSSSIIDSIHNNISLDAERNISRSPNSSSNPKKLFTSIVRLFSGPSSARDSTSPSTSSQAMLLTTTSCDYSDDILDDKSH